MILKYLLGMLCDLFVFGRVVKYYLYNGLEII